MRIRRLDLLRHGHFTDRHLDFEPRPVDLHVVFGANEAGKSTARCAIADFLFGFDARSPHGFRHEYRQLLVGAVLESGERRFEARRRKGTRDTLLRDDGLALDGAEARLGALLGGIDRAAFERMFSLDQQRLRDGGNEILREQGDAARTLFAAGAGLGTLRATIDALDREADGLWGPRRAVHRRFTAAQDRLQSAQQLVREHTLSASHWESLRDAVDKAQRELDGLAATIAEAETARRRLSRIRRVRNAVLRLESLVAQRQALGPVPALPADARTSFDQAVLATRNADVALRELDAEIAARTDRLAGLELDATVLEHEETIGDLHGRRGAILKARADLPSLRRQLGQLNDAIARRARELGWTEADAATLASRAPSRADITQAGNALAGRTAWSERRGAALQALREAVDAIERTRHERDALGAAEDVAALVGRLSAARHAGDPDERIANLARSIAEQQRKLERGLRDLQPPVADVEDWLAREVPAIAEVRAAAESIDGLHGELAAEERAVAAARTDLTRSQAELERATRRDDVVSREAIEAARAQREAGWTLIERRHIDGPAPDPAAVTLYAGGDPSRLVAAYRAAVARADTLADQRFDGAEAAGRLAELARSSQERATELQRLDARAAAVRLRLQEAQAGWVGLWQRSGVTPREPRVMLDWLQARAQARDASDAIESTVAQRDAERATRGELRSGLVEALRSVGVSVDALADDALRPVVEAAQAWAAEAARRNTSRERLDVELAQGEALRARRASQLDELDAEGAAWMQRWVPLATRLALGADPKADALADPDGSTSRARLAILDELREDAAHAETLRSDRIDKIERDLDLFAAEVGRLAGLLDPPLGALAPEDAIARLAQRLRAAQDTRQQHESLSEELRSRTGRRTHHEREQAVHAARIAALMSLAGAASEQALGETIARAERLHGLDADIEALRAELVQQGDGLTEAELAAECAGVDLDAAAVSERQAEERIEELRRRHGEARDALAEARRQLADALGGLDVNEAHARLNAAAAELRGIAGSYLRVDTARQLLRWALERYRRAQQGPLLKRAGELLATLTDGAFEGLEIGYDERDEARILARRKGADAVGIEGLSEGTRDQLYMALRLASVEQRLASAAEPMPFIADDLFVNFDDARTRAGLRVLADLARRTQVLVFTHHAHLLELARAETGGELGVVEL